jgi:hypothetical protein
MADSMMAGRSVTAGRRPSRARRAYDNYGLELIAILVTLGIMAALGDRPSGRALGVLLLGGLFFLNLRISSVGRRGFRVAALVVGPLLVAAAIASVLGAATAAKAVSTAVSLLFVVASPVVIVRRLVRHPSVSVKTVAGALCVYLFIGLFFALVYTAYQLVGSGPFFAQTSSPASIDFVYFSLTTMTTVGFGDLSAAGDLGRMTAAIEAILGQLYLVTVIAVLVGNLTRRRSVDRQIEGEAAGEPRQPGSN